MRRWEGSVLSGDFVRRRRVRLSEDGCAARMMAGELSEPTCRWEVQGIERKFWVI